ncbi:hypothetical protein KSF_011740 [Reticulibacter mediterranei]|uniref:Uncharacterized protein n=1 Tax=Reticulibacter mediterranei TaxID=2778369 RepID=A0A8J3IJ48_9CHLR|nr:hypothetical protein KSF_011740 [Reticulibacter mediterranei]
MGKNRQASTRSPDNSVGAMLSPWTVATSKQMRMRVSKETAGSRNQHRVNRDASITISPSLSAAEWYAQWQKLAATERTIM